MRPDRTFSLDSARTDDEAYERIADEAAALREADFVMINIDTREAVLTALATVARIEALGIDIESVFRMDTRPIATIPVYAKGLRWADSRIRPASAVAIDVVRLRRCRDLLLDECRHLEKRRLLGDISIEGLGRVQDTKSMSNDVLELAGTLEAVRQLRGACVTITADEVERASKVADQALLELARRNRGKDETATLRHRIFALLVRSYDELRRVVTYLRWEHGDAGQLVPSLYNKCRTRRATRGHRTRPDNTEQTVETERAPDTRRAGPALVEAIVAPESSSRRRVG